MPVPGGCYSAFRHRPWRDLAPGPAGAWPQRGRRPPACGAAHRMLD